MIEKGTDTRRDFLKTAGIAAAGAALASVAKLPKAYAAGNDTVKVALVGCGGRGTGAAMDCVHAGGNVKIIAVADAFEEKAKAAAATITKQAGEKADIATDKIFVGLDAYQKAINCGADMVILATPPGFRPTHYEAAVNAGKHVFMEKPVCVCPGGFRRVMAANKIAEEKNLKVSVGLQRHHQAGYLGAMDDITAGKLGDITLLRVYWNGNGIWNRPRREGMTEMQFQVNNWYHFAWLSGDNICEQHVHNLDIGNWVMSTVLNKTGPDWAHPVEANGMGGSMTRGYNGKDVQGQLFDTHFVEYSYENGTRMFSQCRHQPGTWTSVSEFLHSSKNPKGMAVAGQGPKQQFANPYEQEHADLQKAIREDKKHHEGWYGAISTMTAVMGRMATYSGQVVKWDDLVTNGEEIFPKELTWEANPPVLPDKNGFYPIPTPGIYKFGRKA